MEKKTVKCMFCGGDAHLQYETLSLLEGKITIKDSPYYHCTNCKEEYVTNKQMRQTEKQLNTFTMTRPIVSTGRSLAVTIPTDLAHYYNLKKGKKVQLIPEGKNTLKIKMT